jgi:hypothetical protein
MARVVTPLESNDRVDLATQDIDDLALALVTPLGAYDHDVRHLLTTPE